MQYKLVNKFGNPFTCEKKLVQSWLDQKATFADGKEQVKYDKEQEDKDAEQVQTEEVELLDDEATKRKSK